MQNKIKEAVNKYDIPDKVKYYLANDIIDLFNYQADKPKAKSIEAEVIPPILKKTVLLEGWVDVKRTPFVMPIDCKNDCKNIYNDFLTGIVKTKTGVSNIAIFESVIEKLNGKYIKVTIEFEAV